MSSWEHPREQADHGRVGGSAHVVRLKAGVRLAWAAERTPSPGCLLRPASHSTLAPSCGLPSDCLGPQPGNDDGPSLLHTAPVQFDGAIVDRPAWHALPPGLKLTGLLLDVLAGWLLGSTQRRLDQYDLPAWSDRFVQQAVNEVGDIR